MAQQANTHIPSKLTTPQLVELYKYGVKAITAETPQGKELWQNFVLNTPAMTRYGFNNMVVVFAQNPHATVVQNEVSWHKAARRINSTSGVKPVFMFDDKRQMNPEPYYDVADTVAVNGEKDFPPLIKLQLLSPEQRDHALALLDPDYANSEHNDVDRLKHICRKAAEKYASEQFPQQVDILYGVVVAAILSVCRYTNDAVAFCQTDEFKTPESFGAQSRNKAPSEFVNLMHKAVELIRQVARKLSESVLAQKREINQKQAPVAGVVKEVKTSDASEDGRRKESEESGNQGSGTGTAGLDNGQQSDPAGLLRDERTSGGTPEESQPVVSGIAETPGDPDTDEDSKHPGQSADSGSEQQIQGIDDRPGDDAAPVVSEGTDEAGAGGVLHGEVPVVSGIPAEGLPGTGETGADRVLSVEHGGDGGQNLQEHDGQSPEGQREDFEKPESGRTSVDAEHAGTGSETESQKEVADEHLASETPPLSAPDIQGKVIILPRGIDSQEYKVNTMSNEVSFQVCLARTDDIRGPLLAFAARLVFDLSGQCSSVSVTGGDPQICESIAQVLDGTKQPEKLFRYDYAGAVQNVTSQRIKEEAGAQLKLYREYERNGHPITTAVLEARHPPVLQVIEDDQSGLIDEVLNHSGIPEVQLNNLMSGQTRIDMNLAMKLNQVFSTGTPDEWIEWDKQYVKWREKTTALATLLDLAYTKNTDNREPVPEPVTTSRTTDGEVQESVKQEDKPASSLVEELEEKRVMQARFNANVKAVRTLKAVLAEDRTMTDEERETVKLYSGWQGLSALFVQNEDNKANYDILTEIFSSEEFEKAKAESNEDTSKAQDKVLTPAVQEELVRLGFIQGESS